MLIAALAISIFGSGMWAVAMVYEVIHLGGGPLELSLVAAAGSVGLVAFVLAGGIAADRFPQRLLIIAVEGANLAVIASISGLALLGWLQLWHLALGAFVLGVGAAFFFPAYSAILPRILPPEDLLAANGMEGTMRPILQQAAGPAVAGILVAALSPVPRRDRGGGLPSAGLLHPELPRPQPRTGAAGGLRSRPAGPGQDVPAATTSARASVTPSGRPGCCGPCSGPASPCCS